MLKTELKAERVTTAITALNDLLKNYPGMNQGHHLFDNLENLSSYAGEKNYAFEVLLLDKPNEINFKQLVTFFNLDAEASEHLEGYLQNNTPASGVQINQQLKTIFSQIKFYTSAHIPARTTGQYTPALKFIFWFHEEAPATHDLEFIQFRLEAEGGLGLLLSQSPIVGLKSANNFRILPKDLNSITQIDYTGWLLQEKLADKLDLLKAFTIVKSLEKLSTAFSQYLDQEENDIRTRKFGTQQEVNNLKQQEKLNLREVFQRLKADLQRDFAEFEKGLGDRIGGLNQLKEGSLLNKTDNLIGQLTEFEEKEYNEKIQATIPKPFRDQLIGLINTTCENQIEQDIFSFKDFVDQTLTNIRKDIAGTLLEINYQPKGYFNRQNLKSLVEDTLVLNRGFVAEKRKIEIADYFKAAFKPLAIVMTPALAFNLMGGDFKSFLGKFRFFLFIGVPVAIGYSFYSFIKNNKKVNDLFYEREVKKMQDYLKGETKSMVKRFSDEWCRVVVSQIREEQNNLIQNLEYAFSESAEDHKQKLADSQRDIQRRMQGLEQRERAHSTTVKSREQYDKAMLQLKGEINQVFMQSTYES
jgi:hypothetical protein